MYPKYWVWAWMDTTLSKTKSRIYRYRTHTVLRNRVISTHVNQFDYGLVSIETLI